ncbi:hypothetical protein AN401_07060 [Zobellella denitrificans]|uniref:Phage protein n=1 Tax=Zobellella denitrificans TaxID=347534 RepID=A0A291HNC3_9GAMM|nr:hypothetical protein [Zobellella denitrificans]ATG73643.1 hypothetical protein AN401_07060 [Zobellella denitrificans]
MKNKPIDLNNHLFAALERLNDEALEGDKLRDEIERSRAVAGVAKQIIDQQRNILMAEKLRTERADNRLPVILGGDKE